jgi:cathepsin H
MYTQF